MKTIRILADDLTGALDSAAGFTGQVPVFLGRPSADGLASNAKIPVAVVATATRDIAPADLPARLEPVLAWLKSGDIAFKKVDSLLRGNSFAEVAWLARTGGFAQTVFAPAFPAQGRATIDGQQWVIEPGNPGGPRQPAAQPFAEAFADLGLSVGAGQNPRADAGVLALLAPDVVTDAELDALVAKIGLTAPSCLWCGSAGLAHALARSLGFVAGAGAAPKPLPVTNNGPTVLISASHHPVLVEQWRVLGHARQAPTQVRNAHARQLRTALQALRRGVASGWFQLSPERDISPERAALLLDVQTRSLVAGLPKPGRLVVVGGDTLLALCGAASVEALLTEPSPRLGWGCARLIGGVWDGVTIYSRSGAFGATDDLLEMIRLLDGDANHVKGS